MMTPAERDDLVLIEFNLEKLAEALADRDPAKADLLAALRLIDLALRRSA